MIKIIKISGMSCGHCSSRVEKALSAIDNVKVDVNLENATATVNCEHEVSNDILNKAITDIGFTVLSID